MRLTYGLVDDGWVMMIMIIDGPFYDYGVHVLCCSIVYFVSNMF